MKLINAILKDVKRIREVEISPVANMNVIGGRNAQGKSSLLDAIAYCIGGAKCVKANPIRKGQRKASVTVTLDGDSTVDSQPMTVQRTWEMRDDDTVKSTLEIKTLDGFKAPSPQTLLDSLVGKVWFDPLAFTRLDPDEQAKSLKDIVNIDFSSLDEEKKRVYDKRTSINTEGKRLKARFDLMPIHESVGEAPSVDKLLAEQRRIETVNKQNQDVRRKAQAAESHVKMTEAGVEGCKASIATLREQLAAAEAKLVVAEEELARRRVSASGYTKAADLLVDEDPEPVRQQISQASEIAEKVRENKDRARIESELSTLRKEASELTGRLMEIDAEKEKMVTEAKWPIPGLGYDERGVTFNGVPLNQAASSEQIRTSVAIGMALNPTLKVLLVRDGSLLDDDGMKIMTELAVQNDFQIWMEMATRNAEDRKGCSIILEDGEVVEEVADEPAAAAS